MDDYYEHDHRLRALAMRVAALEDNVAFLEEWCEEQQDVLDRAAGPVPYDYEIEPGQEPPGRVVLRVVDIRDEVAADGAGGVGAEDGEGAQMIIAVVETDHDRRIRQIRDRLDRLRTRLKAEA
jgi:uncharacterized coiled-coil protein SlyX